MTANHVHQGSGGGERVVKKKTTQNLFPVLEKRITTSLLSNEKCKSTVKYCNFKSMNVTQANLFTEHLNN